MQELLPSFNFINCKGYKSGHFGRNLVSYDSSLWAQGSLLHHIGRGCSPKYDRRSKCTIVNTVIGMFQAGEFIWSKTSVPRQVEQHMEMQVSSRNFQASARLHRN